MNVDRHNAGLKFNYYLSLRYSIIHQPEKKELIVENDVGCPLLVALHIRHKLAEHTFFPSLQI
jgi:hypothetical protein